MHYKIYTLEDPTSGQIRYVGVTIQTLKRRLKSHVSCARCGKNQYISRWIRTLLKIGLRPIIKEIESTTDYYREAFWIKHYKDKGCRLTNLTDGCEREPGWTHSVEARTKISKAGEERYRDLSGLKFGRLTAMRIVSHNPVKWLCKCECGAETTALSLHLMFHNTKSCGCLSRELSAKRCASRIKHGLCYTSEFHTWQSMLAKCYNRKCNRYQNTGGRGISVCKRWKTSFVNFLNDMGKRPAGHCLNRVNQSLNFTPKNCIWETISQKQSRPRKHQ